MVQDKVTSVMTEWEFWDKFNKKHNLKFYEKLKKEKTQTKKTSRTTNASKRHPVFKVPD